ncbi:hypothetical protein [Ruegeria sp.]|uniref:hypothetical protein n=1 Tax=Ruegeria sp. TaxID=1879320 RepID=UPI003B5CB7E1
MKILSKAFDLLGGQAVANTRRGLEFGESRSIDLGKDNRLRQQTAFRFTRELVAGKAGAQYADDWKRYQSDANQRNYQRKRRPPFLLDGQH